MRGGTLGRRPVSPRIRRRSGRSRWFALGLGLASILVFIALAGAGLAGIAGVTTVAVLSDGLPDPARFEDLSFDQPTIVYDRTGKVELGRFERVQRQVISYDQLPHLVVDATTSAEDRTFWTNEGYDPAQILSAVAENVSGASYRGASTITQQLVRARLLPQDVLDGNQYVRKAKEVIQAARLTQEFPGEAGKERIITAYLNQIYYGHNAYGIAAAARVYFGVTDLSKLTIAQAALLAGLPKSPSAYDPYKFAKQDKKGRLVVDPTSPPIVRRNYVLDGLRGARWTHLTNAQITAAEHQPVILAGDQPLTYQAPHFMWQVRDQLIHILGSADKVDTGGYRVTTTLDMRGQQLAEKYVAAAAIAPNLGARRRTRLLDTLHIRKADRAWLARLTGKDVHNAALVAIDYTSGDVLAYVGSAGYYRDKLASRKFNPKYDVLSSGFRQPGSAWKPVLYSTAFERHALTPGSLLLDITTKFGVNPATGKDWAPHDADNLERGPVRVRQALQYSLNIPAIRALGRVGNKAVADQAQKLGITFQGGAKTYQQAGLAGAIGTVEVRPVDLVSAFGTLANGGVRVPPRMILEIDGPDGRPVWKAPDPTSQGKQAISPQAAFLTTDILDGNTDPSQNPIWSSVLELKNGPKGVRRPTAVKTGTTNDTRDLATYGYTATNAKGTAPAIAAGVWMGNSDHSQPHAPANEAVISLQGPAPLWHAFMRDYTSGKPVGAFDPPKGVVRERIDAFSGGKPTSSTRDTVREWFIKGTGPSSKRPVDPPGLLYTNGCVNVVNAELGPSAWRADDASWQHRAARGVGVTGRYGTKTTYFWGQHSWGGRICGAAPPRPKHTAPPKAHGHGGGGHGGGGHGHGGGHGGGGHGGGGNASPTPQPAPTATPKPTSSAGGTPSIAPGDATGPTASLALALSLAPLAPLLAGLRRRAGVRRRRLRPTVDRRPRTRRTRSH
ncbi:MAG TPA: transglycosylase domain-containing protein [Candidatus Limnocylindrales bacterium]|nr:transglycosylase domain-containing protein [Candidatus Limnocylindrales bacterium]